MPTKQELEKELAETLSQPIIEDFYKQYLENDSQGNTVITLETGVKNGKITIEQALKIALLVGIQWKERF
jgi:hypothetical protein